MKAKQEVTGLEISLDDPIIASLGMKTETDSLVKGSVCGKLSLNIKSNGDITPCGFIPIVIGNIVKDDLKEVWFNSIGTGQDAEQKADRQVRLLRQL